MHEKQKLYVHSMLSMMRRIETKENDTYEAENYVQYVLLHGENEKKKKQQSVTLICWFDV